MHECRFSPSETTVLGTLRRSIPRPPEPRNFGIKAEARPATSVLARRSVSPPIACEHYRGYRGQFALTFGPWEPWFAMPSSAITLRLVSTATNLEEGVGLHPRRPHLQGKRDGR